MPLKMCRKQNDQPLKESQHSSKLRKGALRKTLAELNEYSPIGLVHDGGRFQGQHAGSIEMRKA